MKERTFKDKKKINSSPGIYLLFDNEKIVYVGQALDPEQRLRAHISNKKFDSYYIIRCEKEQLDDLEIEYILEYLPKYNKTLKCSKTRLSFLGQVNPTINKRISIPCVIIGNRLYADLSKIGIQFER